MKLVDSAEDVIKEKMAQEGMEVAAILAGTYAAFYSTLLITLGDPVVALEITKTLILTQSARWGGDADKT